MNENEFQSFRNAELSSKTNNYQEQVLSWRDAPVETPPVNDVLDNSGGEERRSLVVAARCRPVLGFDGMGQLIPGARASSEPIINFEAITVSTADRSSVFVHQEEAFAGLTSGEIKTSHYRLHRTFGPEADDVQIFQELLQPVLCDITTSTGPSCGWFINYGMTGSGKTYTCINAYHFIVDWLFSNCVATLGCTITLSMVELRGDTCYDLLSETTNPVEGDQNNDIPIRKKYESSLKVTIREDGDGKIKVPSSNVILREREEAVGFLDRFLCCRCSSSTVSNEASSRSHAIISFKILSGDREAKEIKIVDLAGCERHK